MGGNAEVGAGNTYLLDYVTLFNTVIEGLSLTSRSIWFYHVQTDRQKEPAPCISQNKMVKCDSHKRLSHRSKDRRRNLRCQKSVLHRTHPCPLDCHRGPSPLEKEPTLARLRPFSLRMPVRRVPDGAWKRLPMRTQPSIECGAFEMWTVGWNKSRNSTLLLALTDSRDEGFHSRTLAMVVI